MHLSPVVWIIVVVLLIGVPVALDAFFDLDISEKLDTPLGRSIMGFIWLYMACLAFRDVIASKGLSVDPLFGFAFCAGGVIYTFWPRKENDAIKKEIEEEVRRQLERMRSPVEHDWER